MKNYIKNSFTSTTIVFGLMGCVQTELHDNFVSTNNLLHNTSKNIEKQAKSSKKDSKNIYGGEFLDQDFDGKLVASIEGVMVVFDPTKSLEDNCKIFKKKYPDFRLKCMEYGEKRNFDGRRHIWAKKY